MNCNCPYHENGPLAIRGEGCQNEGTETSARYGLLCNDCYLHLLEEWAHIFMVEFGLDSTTGVEQAKRMLQTPDNTNSIEFSKDQMKKRTN
jgi:hypothetical protein